MGALRQPMLQRLARAPGFVYRRSARGIALSPAIADAVAATGAAPARVRVVRERLRPRAVLALRSTAPPSAGVSGSATASSAATSAPWARRTTVAQVEAAALVDGATFVLLGQGKPRTPAPRSSPGGAARSTSSSSIRSRTRRLARLAAASNACLTIFKDVPVLATGSPNKLFDTFAGRPASSNRPAGSVNWSSDTRSGCSPGPGRRGPRREGRLAERPSRRRGALRARNARRLAEREFDRELLAARALAVLQEAAG